MFHTLGNNKLQKASPCKRILLNESSRSPTVYQQDNDFSCLQIKFYTGQKSIKQYGFFTATFVRELIERKSYSLI